MVATVINMLSLSRYSIPRLLMAAAVAGLAIIAIVLVVRWRPGFSAEKVRAEIITTLQQEARASFLVTGTLDIVATTSVTNTRTLLPGLLDVSLGTTKATIQVPGRVHYGFDVRRLNPKDIVIDEEGVVTMTVPTPMVYSVEPDLEQLRVWTSKGWARGNTSVQRAERRALATVNTALSNQAKAHIENSMQPHINTAHALERLLRPVLRSAGISKPAFRFQVGERIVMEPAS
jgi:hypothetical protein